MLKKILVILIFLSGNKWTIIFAQNYFNNIYKVEESSTIFTESLWRGDTLYLAGTVSKSIGRTGVIIKVLQDGSLYKVEPLIDSFIDFRTGFWHKGFLDYNDTLYHVADKEFDGSKLEGLILKFNNGGTKVHEKAFMSYYSPNDDYSQFLDFDKTTEGFIILDVGRKTQNDVQACLVSTDNNFNQLWRNCYGNGTPEIPEDLIVRKNGSTILGNFSNIDISGQYEGSGNGYSRGFIFGIDTLGDFQWEWRSTSKREAIYAGHLVNDSIIVVAAGQGKEICSDSQTNAICYLHWTGKVFQFNLNSKQKVWETSLSGGPYTSMFDNRYLDIIPSVEGDGYILCGAGYDKIPDCRIDTVDKCWAYPGVIAKISSNGDSLWMRKYFGVQDIFESNILFDAEISPDSGYSFVGEAFNPWPRPTQGQNGWILKTDKYGCIIPGCHLISSNSETAEFVTGDILKIFPNPIVDNLNILIAKPIATNSKVVLFNLLGQIIKTWDTFELGATYSIPIDNVTSGIYFIAVMTNNYIIESQKIFIK